MKQAASMVPRARRVFVGVVAALFAFSAEARSQAATPPSSDVKGELWFDAKASLGPFRGTTRVVRAEMTGGAALADVRGFVEFNAADLSTNNGLRDRDMRSSLEVQKYPKIRFDLDSVAVQSDAADSVRADLYGRMQIHGVTRQIRVPAVVRQSPGVIRVTGDFDLVVTEYGVKGLKKMLGMLSMDETVKIGLDLTFTIAREGTEGAR